MAGSRAVTKVAPDAFPSLEEQRADADPPARADDEPEELRDVGRPAVPARGIRSEEDPDHDQDERGDVEEDRQAPGGDGIPNPGVVFAAFLEDTPDALDRQRDHDRIEASAEAGQARGR